MCKINCLMPISLGLILISTTAHADISGLGGAVGGVGASVGSTVGGVTSSVSSTASSSVGSSVSDTSASATASASATVRGVAKVGLCAEANVNSDSSGSCSTAQAATPKNPATAPDRLPSRAALSSELLLGMRVMGAGDELVGRVKSVSLDQAHIKWILVEMGNKRQVRLTNAIRSVDNEGIKLGLTRRTIESRIKGNFTRIRVQCSNQQSRLQDPNNLNSCWDGRS